MKFHLGQDSELSYVQYFESFLFEMLMFDWDFEVSAWLRF